MSSLTFSTNDWQRILQAFHLTDEQVRAVLNEGGNPVAAVAAPAPPARLTNETSGITAEKAMCMGFNIPHDIGDHRIDNGLLEKLVGENVLTDICQLNGILPHTHIGGDNEKTDFLGNAGERDITISLKTLKRTDGKIAPSCSQLSHTGKNGSLGAFHTQHFPECTRPAPELSRREANTLRWNWIKSNIGMYLNKMQSQLFCCDFLILVRNCDRAPQAELLKNKKYDFNLLDIGFSHPDYDEPPHPRGNGDNVLLNETDNIIYKNIGSVNKENRRMGIKEIKGYVLGCKYMIILLLGVLVLFIGTYLFMKVVSPAHTEL